MGKQGGWTTRSIGGMDKRVDHDLDRASNVHSPEHEEDESEDQCDLVDLGVGTGSQVIDCSGK